MIVAVPGGREGAARAGALPTPEFHATGGPPPGATVLTGKQYGPAQIFLDATIEKDTPMAASILTLPAGGKVPEHVHAKETEVLYVLEGSGTMTLAGQAFVKGDGKQTVEQLLKGQGASVNGFVMYVVGEGIEKKKDDFAAEVAAMAKA